jgi:hypothetical protein
MELQVTPFFPLATVAFFATGRKNKEKDRKGKVHKIRLVAMQR